MDWELVFSTVTHLRLTVVWSPSTVAVLETGDRPSSNRSKTEESKQDDRLVAAERHIKRLDDQLQTQSAMKARLDEFEARISVSDFLLRVTSRQSFGLGLLHRCISVGFRCMQRR